MGTEAEKCGVYDRDASALPYDGERGVRRVLLELAQRHGWTAERETDEGEVIALKRGQASITLEPGAQLELSGAPVENVHETCAEFRGHMAELRDISTELGITWLGLGFHPFARQADLPWVPKLRYAVMREYLPTRGSMALDMMRRTCTVQANFDYDSEEDAVRKLRVALRLQPVVTAMFANSPFVEGRITGERSHRARVWLHVDPDRSGLLPWAWDGPLSFARYVEWALDVPMFLVKRGEAIFPATHLTFRQFVAQGLDGQHATMGDWETHLNTLFPEVRLKRTLEVRGADSQDTSMICALPALWKGILYDDQAFGRAETLAATLAYEEVEASRPGVADHALRAKIGRHEVGALAGELLGIAEAGLRTHGCRNAKGQDETIHLARLRALVERGQSPADALLEHIDAKADLRPQILEKARV